MTSNELDPRSTVPLALARASVAECFADVDERSMRHIGSGCDFDAFLTADDWVFRFPRHQDGEARLTRERRVLQCVSPFVASVVTVPTIERVGEATAGFPYTFGGHRYIRGLPCDCGSFPMTEFQRALARALGAIHAIPEEDARRCGIAELDPEEPGRKEWFEEARESALKFRGSHPKVDEALDWVRDVPWPPPPFGGTPRLIHQDLSPEHVIVNPDSGAVRGIIDWGDAALGNPARDFVFLVIWKGWRFTDQVVRLYPGPLPEEFWEQLRFMARLLSVLWLGSTAERGRPASHFEGIRNAYSR